MLSTGRFPLMGRQLYIAPVAIGIKDIHSPEFGDAVPIYDNEVPVFWACGVTSGSAYGEQALPCHNHALGYMFVGIADSSYAVF